MKIINMITSMKIMLTLNAHIQKEKKYLSYLMIKPTAINIGCVKYKGCFPISWDILKINNKEIEIN